VGNLVSIGRNYESIAENRIGRNSVWLKLTNGILVEEEEERERGGPPVGVFCLSLLPLTVSDSPCS
jgi:hypothetical protein